MKSTLFEPRRNLANELVAILRGEILSGVLQPGEALAEPGLAKRFGVSRAPVREAMIELERAGLIQFEVTGRTRVRTLEEKDIREIVETRIALETMGARLAAMRWTENHTRWMEENITAQENASSVVEFSQLDVAMHEYIMKSSGNERLIVLWQYIYWQFEMALTFIHHLQNKLAYDLRRFTIIGHQKLLDKLASRQPEPAAKMMAQHINGLLEWFTPEMLEAPTEGNLSPKVRTTRSRETPTPASMVPSLAALKGAPDFVTGADADSQKDRP